MDELERYVYRSWRTRVCANARMLGQQSVAGDCFATANHEQRKNGICNQTAVLRTGLKDVNGDQKKVSR